MDLNVSNSAMDISQYDNVSPVENTISLHIRQVNGRYYCQYCTMDYAFDYLLRKHLRTNHEHDLQTPQSFSHICPICEVKFVNIDVVSKHLFKHQHIFEHLFKKEDITFKCLFCGYSVSNKMQMLLVIHLEKKHLLDFYEYVCKNKYLIFPSFVENQMSKSVNKKRKLKLTDEAFNFQTFKKFFNESQFKAQNNEERKTKNIRPEQPKSILKFKEKTPARRSARKALTFDLSDKENNPKTGDLLDFNEEKSKKFSIKLRPRSTSTPSKVSPPHNLRRNMFKCSKCWQSYSSNDSLVSHIQKAHNKLTMNILQPKYQCARCNVKFYKNSFLTKHCKLHHGD